MTVPVPNPVDAEDAAQAWHEERVEDDSHEDEFSGCWCCCEACRVNNPHYEAAKAAWRNR